MKQIKIGKGNINLIMDKKEICKEIDMEFLNALWQYVLFSRNESRTAPFCEICYEHGKFMFEGFGGIKKVGNGNMFIPIKDNKLYIIPDIIFHYFYIHNAKPSSEFRESVIYGVKPDSEEYAEKIKPFYKPRTSFEAMHIKCPHCGMPLESEIAYAKGNSGNVTVYQKKGRMQYREEEFVDICFNCLHYIQFPERKF